MINAPSAGYFDLTGELTELALNGTAEVDSRRVLGKKYYRKEWTSRDKSIDIGGYMADWPTRMEQMFDNLEEGKIAFYHENAGKFCMGDYYLGNLEPVDDNGLYVLNGTAEADGRVYWGSLISAAAGTDTAITAFADGYVMVHITETNGTGTLTIRYTANSNIYTAAVTNAEGLYWVQPLRSGAAVTEADEDGNIRAVEAGGIDAEYVWGWAA